MFLAVTAVGIVLDWAVSTRLAAYSVDREYAYRPSAIRYSLIALIALSLAVGSSIQQTSGEPWMPGLFVGFLFIAIYGYFLIRDVGRGFGSTDTDE